MGYSMDEIAKALQIAVEAHKGAVEESGIPSVAVECVDIRRNTRGEGDFLAKH